MMQMYKITPKANCTKHQLRVFYMHADGIVNPGYKERPSTTVPLERLHRVLWAVSNAHRFNKRAFVLYR